MKNKKKREKEKKENQKKIIANINNKIVPTNIAKKNLIGISKKKVLLDVDQKKPSH